MKTKDEVMGALTKCRAQVENVCTGKRGESRCWFRKRVQMCCPEECTHIETFRWVLGWDKKEAK